MEDCTFCDPMVPASSGILYEDEIVMAFRDIHPRAAIHILVVPKQHIKNTSELNEKHVALVRYMVSIGKSVIQQECQLHFTEVTISLKDHQYGFHQYPFNSVNHLHLHCLVPPFQNCWNRLRFHESILGHYISADALIENLLYHS